MPAPTSLIAIACLAALGLWIIDRQTERHETIPLTCQDCLRVAQQVTASLDNAARQAAEARSGPGRNMNLALSEKALTNSLDTACDAFTDLDRHESCQRALSPHREALEDRLFQSEDYTKFPFGLCADVLNLCTPHEITSAGEL